jgi:spore germination cell wall hydrolase CwlJ-like protein
MKDPKKNKTRRRCHNRHKKNQTSKDGWADYEGEVSRYEDRYPKKDISPKEEAIPPTESARVTVENKEEKTVQQAPYSKSTSPTKQVWKVKIKSVSNSTQEEVQPEAPFEPSEVPWEV